MSGICGLFNLDGAPVAEAGLADTTAMLEARGPDRTGHWRDGAIGLGHTLLATTPEAQFEQQPVVHAETGCVITADVRLDNREELHRALRIGKSPESIGDAELILAAYLAWGERCVERLLGDFAFALWDPRQQQLLCARDHFGLRPFYYHHAPRRLFAFASAPQAILVLPDVPYVIDEGRIADFLVPEFEWIDYTSTFFEGVNRLPPGHTALASRDGITLREYWQPAPGPDPGPLSDEAFAEGFLEVFTRAVEARLRTPHNAACATMSGGIDSGSVVAVAKDLLAGRGDGPLHTVSAVNPGDPGCAETSAIRAAAGMPGVDPAFVEPDDVGGLYDALSAGYDEPFDGEFTFLKAVYLAAQSAGHRVVLDGAGGDVLLSEGSYIARLIRHGRWRTALAEIAAERRFWDGAIGPASLFRYARAALVPDSAKRLYRRLRPGPGAGAYLADSLIARDFARDVDIEARLRRLREMFPAVHYPDYAAERCSVIRPNISAGRERYARLAAAAGVEASDPYLDKRVVEYGAWLPGHLRVRDGWPKIVLRDLMSGRLPQEVVWNRGKPHLGWCFNAAVTRQAIDRGAVERGRLQAALRDYVAPETLEAAWTSFVTGNDIQPLQTARVLSAWLRENRSRPVVAH